MKTKRVTLLAFCIALTLFNSTAYAIETIQLQNRTAAEIIPSIKPLLKKNDAITGNDYKLFIRTDKKTLNSILPIIKQLDKKLISLMITVKTSNQNQSQSSDITLDFKSSNNSKLTNRTTHSTRSHNPNIRTIEGARTFIYTGEAAVRPSRQFSRQNNQLIEHKINSYQQARTGFYATTRIVNNNEIILNIEPQQQSLNLEGNNNQFSLHTTIRGKLGEWIELGQVDKQNTNKKSALNTHTDNAKFSVQTTARDTIFVKVDRLD